MFGILPAYGLYLRHIKGLTFEDVTLDTAAPDLRPALVGEDVEDLELSSFRAAETGPAALLRLCNAHPVYLHGCRPLGDVALFLSVEGNRSRGILLQANDLCRASEACVLTESATPEAINSI